jgi:hypothetical protein
MSIISQFLGRREASAPTAAEIAAQIQQQLPAVQAGTLRFWGVWFGRPHDNFHTIVKAEADGDCLVLHFNEEETLRVWHPQACQIDSRQFVISLASRVLWRWFWYGRPHTPDNLMRFDFVRSETTISFKSTFPPVQVASPSFNEPAVQIH